MERTEIKLDWGLCCKILDQIEEFDIPSECPFTKVLSGQGYTLTITREGVLITLHHKK
ncbi:hypothetical protein ES703_66357 [subsurface metagenome]